MNPGATGSGWPGCCRDTELRFMSFTPAAWRCRVSSAGPRLDTEMLIARLAAQRAGTLPDGRDPAQEDARRPGREREGLIAERTRLTNTIKAELALWGIQGFKPGLKKAAEHLEAVRTIDGEPLPPNTLARLHRLLERRTLISDQIKAIELAAVQAVERDPERSSPASRANQGHWPGNGADAGAGSTLAQPA